MLLLTRRQNEKLIIGGNIKVSVVKIRGGQVTLGVDAPRDISVNREEIQDKINLEVGATKNG